MGWWNEPFQKWDFKFRGRSWKKYPLQLPSWAHNWNLRRMNFMKMPEEKKISSQLLPQLASDYPPPIWSLSSPHLIIGYRWICRISFHIFHHICSKWQCSEPHIMYYTIFGSGFSTHLPLGVDQANLVIYTLNFVLVLLGNATCTGMMYTTADWSSRFLRNITAFASEFPHYWSAILKIRGGILQIREWTTARGVELIHLYSKGEQRSGMPMLGFWPSTLQGVRWE